MLLLNDRKREEAFLLEASRLRAAKSSRSKQLYADSQDVEAQNVLIVDLGGYVVHEADSDVAGLVTGIHDLVPFDGIELDAVVFDA